MGTVEPDRDDLAPLHVVVALPIDLEHVPAILGADALPWLGERAADGPDELRRYRCDLEFHPGGMRPVALRKAALVGLGAPKRDDAGWLIAIEWQAATLAPLFPVFAGWLWLRADRVVLDGHYAPPGGRLGRAADALLLGIAARGTARWFIGLIAARLAPSG